MPPCRVISFMAKKVERNVDSNWRQRLEERILRKFGSDYPYYIDVKEKCGFCGVPLAKVTYSVAYGKEKEGYVKICDCPGEPDGMV